MFSFRSTLTECTVRVHGKIHFTLQRHWKSLFVSYEKNKKNYYLKKKLLRCLLGNVSIINAVL